MPWHGPDPDPGPAILILILFPLSAGARLSWHSPPYTSTQGPGEQHGCTGQARARVVQVGVGGDKADAGGSHVGGREEAGEEGRAGCRCTCGVRGERGGR